MSEAVAVRDDAALDAHLVEQVLIGGDLSKLSAQDRVRYYQAVCRSLNLNPLTKPFEYLHLSGKLVLYARRDCADQLRRGHGISLEIIKRETFADIYVVTSRATDRDGRTDESTGAVYIGGLKGEALANALMKAETKAKRRVTLSIAGLGFLDETEVEALSAAPLPTREPGSLPSGKTNSPRPSNDEEEGKKLLLKAIRQALLEQVPGKTKDDDAKLRVLMLETFGVAPYKALKALSLAALQVGYAKLQPPEPDEAALDDDDEDDVPDHPGPAAAPATPKQLAALPSEQDWEALHETARAVGLPEMEW
ncbi:MAG: hypothetical protein U1A73_04555, partial [Pseudomonas sp.]|nr:hypothetical protein [Pseudomonas sp.]